jgi:hypothetical protein
MKNKLGLILCTLYLILTALCLYGAYTAQDDKGWVLLMQLPLILPAALLDIFGLEESVFGNLSWTAAYLIFVPVTLALLYFLGKFIEKFAKNIRSKTADNS